MPPDREAPTGERGQMNAIPPTALPSAAGPTIPPGPLTLLWVREGTALAGLFPRKLPTKLRNRVPRLLIEGSLAAAVSLVFAWGADASQAAMISRSSSPPPRSCSASTVSWRRTVSSSGRAIRAA